MKGWHVMSGPIVALLLVLLLVVGCGQRGDGEDRGADPDADGASHEHLVGPKSILLWRDPATGCEYFWPSYEPRLTPDGKPRCQP